MKTYLKSAVALIGGLAMTASSYAQLHDESNVTITMDLQPVLQLKMEGPDQIDFTFDEINKYYAGITKYGANILKVSASVSFDLWAAGLSMGQEGNHLWDNPVEYSTNTNSVDDLPITALELHQFPANPSIAAGCDPGAFGALVAENHDYSNRFEGYDYSTNGFSGGAVGNNPIYSPGFATPYLRPQTETGGAPAEYEKYIAGAESDDAFCQIAAGSYLLGNSINFVTGNSVTTPGVATNNAEGWYYVMDYRILPGLPVKFPASLPANCPAAVATQNYIVNADGATAVNNANINYARPGVYTMYIKYILAEDL